jgi:hypothetical protein
VNSTKASVPLPDGNGEAPPNVPFTPKRAGRRLGKLARPSVFCVSARSRESEGDPC